MNRWLSIFVLIFWVPACSSTPNGADDCPSSTCTYEHGYKLEWLPPEKRDSSIDVGFLMSYRHLNGGHVTGVSRRMAETLYAKPDFYAPITFCAHHGEMFHMREFVLTETGENLFEWRTRRIKELAGQR
ncbi:MAG: hypothetical protein OEU49_08395 [Chromatiales bacterium]|nr:hypothetical protein [Chromatiales bacterium]